MAFDPDKYLAESEPSTGFDPDAYLSKKASPTPKAKAEPSQLEQVGEFFQGMSLPIAGAVQSIPYEPLQRKAAEYVKGVEAKPEYIAPGGTIGARTLGKEITKGGAGLIPIGKGIEFTAGLSMVPQFLARTLGGAAVAGGTEAFLTEAPDYSDIGKKKAESGLQGAVVGGVLSGTVPLAGQIASKGYKYVSKLMDQAFGGDAKRMATALRDYAQKRTGAEADAAKKLADEAEQKAGIAETSATRQARRGEEAYKELPGTTTQKEAGRFRPIPASEQSIGDEIRTYVNNTFKALKEARNTRAEKNKGEAFNFAAAKEKNKQKVADTEGFREIMVSLERARKSEAGLSNAPGSIGNQIREIENLISGKQVDPASGVVVGRDVSFEGLEKVRRLLKDRQYGVPETGFDAIPQAEAGKYADMLTKAMKEFTTKPGEKVSLLEKFLTQYKQDSEPLRVFGTRAGKIFEEQLPGVKGYSKVASENIPSKLFANRESYQGLIEASGGNKQFAEAQARKYFASKMEQLANDPAKIEKFIKDNRTMLNITGARDMAEKYYAQAAQAAKRAETGTTIAKEAGDVTRKQRALQQDFAKFNSDLNTATKPDEIAGLHKNFAKKLLDEGMINNRQYETMRLESDRVIKQVTDTEQAKKQLASLAARILGYGVAGGAAYGAVRYGNQ
jgi:hypothetical protein